MKGRGHSLTRLPAGEVGEAPGTAILATYVVVFRPKADAGIDTVYRPPRATGWLGY